MTDEEVWSLVIAHERALRRDCGKYLPRNMSGELDEIYGDVVIGRAISIMATFDPSRGTSPLYHLRNSVRWYAFKWLMRRRRRMMNSLDAAPRDDEQTPAYEDDNDARQVVDDVLSGLSELDANLVRWQFSMGCTLQEIADHLGVEKSRAKALCAQARARALNSLRRPKRYNDDDAVYGPGDEHEDG